MLEKNHSMPALRPREDATCDADQPGDISSRGWFDIITETGRLPAPGWHVAQVGGRCVLRHLRCHLRDLRSRCPVWPSCRARRPCIAPSRCLAASCPGSPPTFSPIRCRPSHRTSRTQLGAWARRRPSCRALGRLVGCLGPDCGPERCLSRGRNPQLPPPGAGRIDRCRGSRGLFMLLAFTLVALLPLHPGPLAARSCRCKPSSRLRPMAGARHACASRPLRCSTALPRADALPSGAGSARAQRLQRSCGLSAPQGSRSTSRIFPRTTRLWGFSGPS